MSIIGENESIIYLFSSTFRSLYKLDIYNTLAYPSGFVMHFRYRDKWIDDEIKNINVDNLLGKEVIVVSVLDLSFEEKVEFFPLRKGKIISSEWDGSTLHIYFELLEEWIDYKNKINVYDKLIKNMNNVPKDLNDKTGAKFVIFGRKNNLKFSKDIKSWEYIVEQLASKEPFKKGLFYKLNRIYDTSSNENANIDKLGNELEKCFILKGGNRYTAEFSINFGKEPPVEVENDLFKVEGGDILKIPLNEEKLGFIVDLKKFSLFPKKSISDSITFMNVKIEGSNSQIEGPILNIPIKIKRSFKVFLVGFAIFVGLILVSGIFTNPITNILNSCLDSSLPSNSTISLNGAVNSSNTINSNTISNISGLIGSLITTIGMMYISEFKI